MCGVAEGALALAAVSTAMGGYGMYQQGQQQQKQAEYQAAVANNNSIVAEQNAQIQDRAAQDALSRGRIEEQQHRLKVAQMKGTQRSALAASGVQVDTGSALDMVADTAMMGEMDALTIRNNAERESYNSLVGAYNARAQASTLRAEAGLQMMAGRNAARNGTWGAATTLLGGAAQIGMNYSLLSSYEAFKTTPTYGSKALTGSVAKGPYGFGIGGV